MEHDSPSLLFRLGCEYLRAAKVIRPGVVSLLEKVATAREAAERETHARYEAAVDIACARPKIIASTATIRRVGPAGRKVLVTAGAAQEPQLVDLAAHAARPTDI